MYALKTKSLRTEAGRAIIQRSGSEPMQRSQGPDTLERKHFREE